MASSTSTAESSPSASPNKQEPAKGSEESTESQSLQFPHSGEYIYISYHLKHQKAMWELKTGFESDGIRVWMDVGEKKGSTKETIAKAVGKASYVVIAMSREYQSNPKCRLEAECAYKLGKEVLPLLMENDYEPDGWLKLIVKRNRVMHFDIDASGGRHQRLKELTNTTAADDEDSDDEDSDDEDSDDGIEGSEDSTDSAESLQFPREKTQLTCTTDLIAIYNNFSEMRRNEIFFSIHHTRQWPQFLLVEIAFRVPKCRQAVQIRPSKIGTAVYGCLTTAPCV
ncbi:PREDICTED: uncharacterized protein LOC107333165 [Acropora digitifera]|uniref:uncharacterized protein LOC107333165 n=1 Tax=Acropora digitifera TaxID=70779 RepID=UPI00077A9DA8|nr:PREDICTED: uncharacterized protein LOC107333165 [Acropora digitifera]XP_015753420.1 PREDICTED: uncharacterized protein LOC107333165 [Acropora digitifera]XP_015753421.1 PREDICTED: uncharacterized protein LOC107333165 [Acropora digitifera]